MSMKYVLLATGGIVVVGAGIYYWSKKKSEDMVEEETKLYTWRKETLKSHELTVDWPLGSKILASSPDRFAIGRINTGGTVQLYDQWDRSLYEFGTVKEAKQAAEDLGLLVPETEPTEEPAPEPLTGRDGEVIQPGPSGDVVVVGPPGPISSPFTTTFQSQHLSKDGASRTRLRMR